MPPESKYLKNKIKPRLPSFQFSELQFFLLYNSTLLQFDKLSDSITPDSALTFQVCEIAFYNLGGESF